MHESTQLPGLPSMPRVISTVIFFALPNRKLVTAPVFFSSALSLAPAHHSTSGGMTPQAGIAWRSGFCTDQCTTPCYTRLLGTYELPRLHTRADKSKHAVHVWARLLTDPSCSLSHLLRRTRTQPPKQKAAPDCKQSHLCIRCRVPMQRAGVGTRGASQHSERKKIPFAFANAVQDCFPSYATTDNKASNSFCELNAGNFNISIAALTTASDTIFKFRSLMK